LFIEEMLHMLIDEGAMQQRDGEWVVAGSASGLPAPKTIQSIVSARLDRLQAEERAVIQRAAVVGSVFYWGAIDELSPPDARAGVGAHLQTLLRKEFIAPEPSAFAGEDAFRFSHILVRDAAYDSIPKRTTAQLHEAFAGWLERVSGARMREQEEVIGYHLEQAARDRQQLGLNDERTRELARRAAERLGAAGVRAIAHGDGIASRRLLARCRVLWQYSKHGAAPGSGEAGTPT
jgi:predicted ATPase